MDAKKCAACNKNYAAGRDLTLQAKHGELLTHGSVTFRYSEGDTVVSPKDLCHECLDTLAESLVREMKARAHGNTN